MGTENAKPGISFTAQALATRIGVSSKRLRSILRATQPRDVKGKKWEIPAMLAKQLEKDYKATIKECEAHKKADIEKQLARKA